MTSTPIQIDGETPVTLTITAAEAKAVCEMCDIVVRSQGIGAAQAALHIHGKFSEALNGLVEAAKDTA